MQIFRGSRIFGACGWISSAFAEFDARVADSSKVLSLILRTLFGRESMSSPPGIRFDLDGLISSAETMQKTHSRANTDKCGSISSNFLIRKKSNETTKMRFSNGRKNGTRFFS